MIRLNCNSHCVLFRPCRTVKLYHNESCKPLDNSQWYYVWWTSVMLRKPSAVCCNKSRKSYFGEMKKCFLPKGKHGVCSGPLCTRKSFMILFCTFTWLNKINIFCHALVAVIFQSCLFYKKSWMHCLCDHLQTWMHGHFPCSCVCPASHFALNILKTLMFLLPHQSFCTSPVPVCGFGWPVSVVDAFYAILLMLHLTDLPFIFNVTAEHWCNESRKWYRCCEWGWSYWYEHWWGLCSIRVFHNKRWIRGEPCFEIVFIVVLVVRMCVYVLICTFMCSIRELVCGTE